MKKFWIKVGVVLTVLLGIGAPSIASAAPTVDINARAALAIDAKSGQVLYAKNADQVLPIASMTKMIGIYLVLEAIHSGKLSWNQEITPDAVAYRISQNHELSNVPLRQDGKYTVRALYQASLIYSANAAMMLLGDLLSGSQAQFVAAMQQQLQQWGIHDAKIVNTTGLNNSALGQDVVAGTDKNAENMMSAKDVAIVAKHLVTDYPEVLQTTKIPEMNFQSGNGDVTKMENFDHMLPGLSAADASLPVDGLKTGTTDLAGANFTGTVMKNGWRLITVVMHANGSNNEARFTQTAALMKYVYGSFVPVTVTKAGQAVAAVNTVSVKHGQQSQVKVAPNQNLTLYLPTGTQPTLQYRAKVKQLEAPTKKGATVGTLQVRGVDFVDGQARVIPVQTQTSVKRANFFVLIWQGIVEFFSHLFK